MKHNFILKQIPKGSVLGLNYSGMHDTAIALVSPEGEPLFAVSLERISRVKQDGRFPQKLLNELPWENIGKVALSVEREYGPVTGLISRFHPVPLETALNTDRSHADSFLQILDSIPVEKVFIPHHLCHAASAFWLSGLSNATCLVYDGGMSNEAWFGGVFSASDRNGIVPIDQFSANNYSNITSLYTAITAVLGFTPLKHEGKITGLAAYGAVTDSCRKILEQWLYHPELLHGIVEWKDMYSQDISPCLKPLLPFVQSLKEMLAPHSREDIAATVQQIAEEHVTAILSAVIKQGEASDNLCLSGGLFANVKINQRASELGFKNLFVSPPMSDDGTALGAALQVVSKNKEFSPRKSHSMFLGPSYSKRKVHHYISESKIKFQVAVDPAKEVAKHLAEGAVVAIYQGPSEFGPRALGNRSILANADDASINQTLNGRLNRTEFMPFAPVCLEEDADRLFGDIEKIRHSAEFMTVTVNCTDEMKLLCPAVVHCDGTARPQIVSKKSNSFLQKVLTYYKELSGKPALVNTSFNVHEEPIVCTPEDAIKGFFESGLDLLFMEGHLIKLCENREIEAEYLRNKIKNTYSVLMATKNSIVNHDLQFYEKDKALEHSQVTLMEQQNHNQQLQTELDESRTNIKQIIASKNQVESTLLETAECQQQQLDQMNVTLVDSQQQIQLLNTAQQEVHQQCQQLEKQNECLQIEARQHDKVLREKESKQQELLLSLIEKETRLQKAAATLTENKQESDKWQAALVDSRVQQQAIETLLQETQQHCQQLEKQIEPLQIEAGQHDKALREKESKQQELLLSLIEKETRLQEATVLRIESRQAFDKLQATLADSRAQQQAISALLQETQQHCQQLEKEIEQLHLEAEQYNELLRERERSINELNHEKEAAKQQIDELHQSNHQWWSMADQQSKELEETRTKIDELNHSSHYWWLEADRLNKELQTVYASKSWRITWPLRKLMQLIKWLIFLPIQSVFWFIHLPKRIAYWVLVKAMAFVLKRPRLRYRATTWLCMHPRLNARLRRVADGSGLVGTQPKGMPAADHPVTESFDNLKNDVQFLNIDTSLTLPLPSGVRKIYVYVDHTVICPTNTGVQRVTRGVATSLRSLGEDVCFVKWDDVRGQCVLINMQERHHLAQWNGPPVHKTELDIYSSNDEVRNAITPHVLGENHWLIVPEVTHITYHQQPVTLDLLQWSSRTGLKTGFIYYDAIPLRREEFKEISPKHAEYMQQLLLADIVWPISQWSADDLIAFLVKNECASIKTMPEIEVIQLPGESQLCPRIQNPQEGETLILSVGSIEPRKNQVQLIKAFEAYRKLHPDGEWRLILVGNLHPLVAEEVGRAQQADKAISHIGHVSDQELDSLYRSCAFTVFPSVEEGFGLPILESLWYGKPCLCANFGAMAEVAEAGGCYTVDTRDQTKIEEAVARLIEDGEFRHRLAMQAVSRAIDSWADYGAAIQARVEKEGHPERGIGRVYYWIDATLEFAKNTGIQRVTRQLARGLIEMGVPLIPVKWDKSQVGFGPVTRDELAFFAKWNGPDLKSWHDWVVPVADRKLDWFFMPELPLNRSIDERAQLLEYARKAGLSCSAVFYDAIPWKMRDIYPVHFAEAHREYMIGLAEYDQVLPISALARDDLIDFLGMTLTRSQGLDEKIKSVLLPGEFPESQRITNIFPHTEGQITILCVGTVEPRKNHETLLQAFEEAAKRINVPLQLIIAGGGHSIEPGLAERVRAFVENHSNVIWEESVDDNRIRELHLSCDFTVYPSIEEGFGLPILESLWYAKPAICANFGAMREAAEGGGCLMVDVRNVGTLAGAIQRLAEDTTLREALALEAVGRPLKSWHDYAWEITARLAQVMAVPFPKLPLAKKEIEARTLAMNLVPRPKLSICISTYNRADWLAVSLKNWVRHCPEPVSGVEFLVCDNASTDHTKDVIKPYLERADFSYHCNKQNVGMLGNLKETAHHATGEYVWILGDDDLLMPNAIEQIMDTLQSHPNIALVYLNYAFTRIEDARTVTDFDAFFNEAIPIVSEEPNLEGPIRNICARNENFFTAIYTLVFRRDHAIKAYSQDTSGRPFSTMLTCIPTTYYVLNHMMDDFGVWIGKPQLIVNMNVSWLKYAPLWILERIPEVYEVAEEHGVPSDQMDRWRRHTLSGIISYFRVIFEDDPLNNAAYFRPDRLVRRFKHLPEFTLVYSELAMIYSSANSEGHPAASKPVSIVFPQLENN
ncbi:MAG: glycosyltransferase [Candidatus Polarisedimenticolaceae bacterium]|nr:glycosyltransferase [Candidatus Polarisedimenticolaceae bacterium]